MGLEPHSLQSEQPLSESAARGYMQHAIALARQGAGRVAPNPLVGAVLVAEGRIIGQGFHGAYGGPHAEVECLRSVTAADRPLVHQADLFVTLEPCAHFGKTPPCADLLIREQVPRVWIATRDPFPEVDGRGIEKLQQAGIVVRQRLLEGEARKMNRRFFSYYEKKRPYLLLKWAQTADGFMAGSDPQQRLLISNEFTQRLVHRWRSEEAAIMVGAQTALADRPQLTNRFWPGAQPIRILVDPQLKVPVDQPLFSAEAPGIVYNHLKNDVVNNIEWVKLEDQGHDLKPILADLYRRRILSVMVEGGARLLHSFIEQNLWDEARIITNTEMNIGAGLPAPVLLSAKAGPSESNIGADRLSCFYNPDSDSLA